jgi:hypothetical protein
MRAFTIEITITTDDVSSTAKRTVIARNQTELEGALEMTADRVLGFVVPALELPED